MLAVCGTLFLNREFFMGELFDNPMRGRLSSYRQRALESVAALVAPIRGRVQGIVDRRFNRARYDAERTALAFGERLRDQVDLPTLADDLGATVRAAVAPTGSGLWLREADR